MPNEHDVLEAFVARVELRGDADRARRRGNRIRRTRRIVVSGVACVALLALGGVALALADAGDESSETIIVDTPTTTTPTTVPTYDRGTWSAVTGNPLSPRRGPAIAWTGQEVLVWGGIGGERDGAAYRPDTATWRRLADPPAALLGAESTSPATVYTDRELIVVSGELHSSPETAAAYDPSNDTWRMLAAPPFEVREGFFTAWTGREAIFYGGAAGDGVPDQTGYAYDPTLDSWREIPNSPLGSRAGPAITWSGTELIVFGGSAMKSSADPHDPRRDGAAYDPTSDTWRPLPEDPYGDPVGRAIATSGSAYVPDLRCDDDCGSAAAFDIAFGTWRDLPDGPVPLLRSSLLGGVAIWGSSHGTIYWPRAATQLPVAPLPDGFDPRGAPVAVALDRLFVLGAQQMWVFVATADQIDAGVAAMGSDSQALRDEDGELSRQIQRQIEAAAAAAAQARRSVGAPGN